MAFSWKSFFNLRKTSSEDVRPVRWAFGFSGGTSVTEDSSMKVSAFYRGVIYISTQIAKLPWDVKDRDNNIVEDRVSSLLNLAPNPEMNAMSFKINAVTQAIIHGNSYAEIERDTLGRAVALWPLPVGVVELVRRPEADYRLQYRISRASYAGEDVFLEPRDVFHVKNFHTTDGMSGQGLVAYASQTLGIVLAADQMAGDIFSNGGLPIGVIQTPGKLSDPAYVRLKESWLSQTGGKKKGSTAILEEGTTYNPINVDPQVLQFLESRKFGVVEIARFLGIPPHKLFDLSASTFSNVENANLEVATDTLDAWVCNLEMEADVKLLNNRFGGRYTEMDLYAVFRGDMDTRSNYFSKMMQVGSMTPNEIRMKEGMAPYPGGSRFYIASNNYTPSDRQDEVIDAQIQKDEAPTGQTSTTESEPADETEKELTAAAVRFLIK